MSLDVCQWLNGLSKTKMNAALKECALAFKAPPKSSLKDLAESMEVSERRTYQLYNNLNVQCEVINKTYWKKLTPNEKDVVATLLKVKDSASYTNKDKLSRADSTLVRSKSMNRVVKKSTGQAKAKEITPAEKAANIQKIMDLVVPGESITKVLARTPDIMSYYSKDISWGIEMPEKLREVLGMKTHHSNPYLCTYGYKEIDELLKNTLMVMEKGLDDVNIFKDQFLISRDTWGTDGVIFTSQITLDGVVGQKIDLVKCTPDGSQILTGRSFWSHSTLALKSFDMLHALAMEAAKQAAMEAAAPKVAGAASLTSFGKGQAKSGQEAADDMSDDEDAAPPLFLRAASL